HLRLSGGFVRVEAAAQRTWDQALQAVAHVGDSGPRTDHHLLTLLRTGHHLCHIASLEELLRSVLGEAIRALGAQRGSLLLAEAALHQARSVQIGSMSSMICVLLRSPRQRLGVLQLDRGPLQDPFDQADFYLADAVAASVAVGIESALLIEQQREQFLQTVTS